MNVEIGTVAAPTHFWEYLFRIFGIGSLQCIRVENIPESIPPPHVGHMVVVPLQLEAAGVRQSVVQPPQSERVILTCQGWTSQS
jgi:hypothetical protein